MQLRWSKPVALSFATTNYFRGLLALGFLVAGTAAHAETKPSCPNCQAWNAPQEPFRIYGNTYYVGVQGLSSILITSNQGHVLIDGDNPESPPIIASHIRTLGFRVEDIKLIVNSHVHFDHAGGIAELQRMSGATVAASPWSADVMRSGHVGRGDPLTDRPSIAPVSQVKTVANGETLHVGPIGLTAHFTPGHTPGGTTWTWNSCEASRCLNVVYADSLNAVSSEGFRFTDGRDYPKAISDFEKSFKLIDSLPCDILLTPHPEFSDLLGRHDRSVKEKSSNPFIESTACRAYIEWEKDVLRKRVVEEQNTKLPQ